MNDIKVFNSIHIDLTKGIFEVNGEKLEFVSELELSGENGHWSLRVRKDDLYLGTNGQKVMERFLRENRTNGAE